MCLNFKPPATILRNVFGYNWYNHIVHEPVLGIHYRIYEPRHSITDLVDELRPPEPTNQQQFLHIPTKLTIDNHCFLDY